MRFEVLPILDKMEELYSRPITRDRFTEYLAELQGSSKDDLRLPIMGYNPMAKDHVNKKLADLKEIMAEQLMSESLQVLNNYQNDDTGKTIQVVLNLADDIGGAWTNKYTTEFESKFKFNALANRDFCAPYFWTSEEYSEDLIKARTLSYACRTLYWAKNGRLNSLEDHVQQELFVCKILGDFDITDAEVTNLNMTPYYKRHKEDCSYSRIFHFFYGNDVCETLGYAKYSKDD